MGKGRTLHATQGEPAGVGRTLRCSPGGGIPGAAPVSARWERGELDEASAARVTRLDAAAARDRAALEARRAAEPAPVDLGDTKRSHT